MLYLIQCYLYAAILYGVYLLLLRNRATHTWNRFYLQVSAALPLFLPLIKIPGISTSLPLGNNVLSTSLPEISVFAAHSTHTGLQFALYDQLFTIIYFTGVVLLLVYFALQYHSFRKFISGKKYELHAGNVKVLLNSGRGPGSFGNYIFFPGNDIDPNILQHELAHVHHKHSRDIVIMKLLQCFFWPNPMIPVIMKELKTVHEFEADATPAAGKDEYIRTLLNDVFQTNAFSLSHTFFHHPIKRRIIMLQKTPQSRRTLRTAITRSAIASLLVITGLVYLQSCSRHTAPEPKVYDYVDHMPQSSVNIPEFLGNNIKYPEAARSKGIEGRVIVRFIVDENGDIKDPTAIRSPDQSLTDEAIRVIRMMPKWEPGTNNNEKVRVHFTLPIQFSLGKDAPAPTNK